MIVGSVCSGIEAATVAWKPLGWKFAFYSEIEAAPSAVLAHHYPETSNHGDFTTVQAGQFDRIDLLVGGTPCQSFSVAGLRGGLADDRGNLALQYLRLADRLRPRWLVWENVPGVLSSNGGRDFGAILGGMVELGYGIAYRVLDAQFVRVDGFARAVPQRRRRVFVVGHLGDWRRAAAVLFERESLSGHSAPRREARASVAALTANGVGTCGVDDNQGQAGHLIAQPFAPAISASNPYGDHESREGLLVAHSLRGEGFDASEDGTGPGTPIVPVAYGGNDTRGPIQVATAVSAHGGPCGRLDFESETFIAFNSRQDPDVTWDRSGSLGSSSPQAEAVAYGAGQRWAVRRLTPLEVERLQGFPDGYTAIPYRGATMADGPRYKALGNSMAVNCMRWIGRRIAAVEALDARDPLTPDPMPLFAAE